VQEMSALDALRTLNTHHVGGGRVIPTQFWWESPKHCSKDLMENIL
jgi:hypothetical protein